MTLLKILLITGLLLMGLHASAQTSFLASAANIYEPPYGLTAQIWNPSSSGETIVVDEVEVTGAPDGALTGAIEWGVGLSNLEQPGCQSTTVIALDGVSTTGVRVSQQPCFINGQPYNTTNYTNTNLYNMKQCWGNVCKFTRPITLPPGRGITIYQAHFIQGNYVNPFPGYVAVNFYWHR